MTAATGSADPATPDIGALGIETRVAEALAQRAHGLVGLVECLARRALADARDIADARRRLDVLSRSLHDGLVAGERAEAGDLRRLAETTLAGFELGPGPRVAMDGPHVLLGAEARRLIALALFDLASRSARCGALSRPEGRVALDWAAAAGGGLSIRWREVGAAPGGETIRRGAGGPLLDLVAARFGSPLRLDVGPERLAAEFALPARDVRRLEPPAPRRALVALDSAAAAVTLGALLHARGVGAVTIARDADDARDTLARGRVDLLVGDARALAIRVARPRPPTILVLGAGAAPPPGSGPSLELPASAAKLAVALRAALGDDPAAGGAPPPPRP